MKHFTVKCLAFGALTLAGSAFAETLPISDIMGMQLKPLMGDAFAQAGTGISIANHQFAVVAPATCARNTCNVVLDYMNLDPKTFVVVHEKLMGDTETMHARVVTVFQQELYRMTYNQPCNKNMALTVTNFQRIYS